MLFLRRLAAAAGAGLVLVAVGAAPAEAHTITGVSPTDYRSEIVGVNPRLPGVSVRLLDLGNRVELVNRGATDVIVLGYQGEPYLRVGPAGAFENRRSPSVIASTTKARTGITSVSTRRPASSNGRSPVLVRAGRTILPRLSPGKICWC